MTTVNHGLDRVRAIFDDDSLVADAGLILTATLVARLGLDELINQHDGPSGGSGRWRPSGPQGVDARARHDQRRRVHRRRQPAAGGGDGGGAGSSGDGPFDARHVPTRV